MDGALISVMLAGLTFSLALNLFFTFKIAARVRSGNPEQNMAWKLPIGVTIPDFHVFNPVDQEFTYINDHSCKPIALVFLSPLCKKCMGSLPGLSRIQSAAQKAGLLFWIDGMESEARIKTFLEGTDLLESVVMLNSETRKMLNPDQASPAYVFIDDKKVLLLQGLIGDDGWAGFLEQMHEIESEENL